MRKRRPLFIELVVLVAWGVAAFVVAARLDVFEAYASWSHQHEELNLDELVVASAAVMFGLGLFGWRRYQELRLAQRVAEQANEAKSLFMANMSHEIRTPLTSVIAGTEMILESALSPQQQRLMESVHGAGERLLKLVDDLLDFSKIEAGQVRVDSLPFDPATVVQQTAALAREACADKNLEFRLTMPEAISQPLLGDAHRLGQVLTNILGNAVKFTSAGHVHLHVQAANQDASSTRLLFTVEDTGTGISPDQHAHIFEPFRQADPSITRHFGGNGLGLAIAKDIVEFMGGTIGVDSKADHGSRFYFEVPFARLPE